MRSQGLQRRANNVVVTTSKVTAINLFTYTVELGDVIHGRNEARETLPTLPLSFAH